MSITSNSSTIIMAIWAEMKCCARLSGRLSAEFRKGDWLGRYGGEELMMVLPGGVARRCRSRRNVFESPSPISLSL